MSNLKYFIPPSEGLKPYTYYVVEVAFNISNPIHKAILAVQDIGNNIPIVGYLFNSSYDPEACSYNKAYYIRVLRKIDVSTPNNGKFIHDIQNIFELEHHNI